MAKVVTAMSGGVDSSVTAGLLLEQGHEVIGVHMKLHDAAPGQEPGTCCGLDDALDARRVADNLGIPFYVMNLREAFKKSVMDNLVSTYLNGATPNPCIQCNGVLKFRVLLARSLALGASHLATGHYARIDDNHQLRTAVDPEKDQTYFLFPVTQQALEKTMFPLGGMTKTEVRAHARRFGFVTAEKQESQDICFIPDGNHARFVKGQRPDFDASGEIVSESGKVLGHHDAYYRFTIGQRKGLGVALGQPAYVSRIDAESRRVVLSPLKGVMHHGLMAAQCNWYDRPHPAQIVHVRIRHRGTLIPCMVSDSDPCEVTFLEPAMAVAPGQAAVFYDGERVLGGGWITTALDQS